MEELADRLRASASELYWLTITAKRCPPDEGDPNYIIYQVPKARGGKRTIAAPKPRLKQIQRAILRELLEKPRISKQAHGFVRGRSIVTNASLHVGQEIVVNMDLKDFFPTITFRRVRGMFRALGYSDDQARTLGLLCTFKPQGRYQETDRRMRLRRIHRCLPQGAPTSPMITNIICSALDARLLSLARCFGARYSRYADDLTFSGPRRFLDSLRAFVPMAKQIIRDEGFHINRYKMNFMRKGARQQVTGIVVNRQLGVGRTKVRRIRAILHKARFTGLEQQNREGREDFTAWLRGTIEYIRMVSPRRGERLRDDFERALGVAALPGPTVEVTRATRAATAETEHYGPQESTAAAGPAADDLSAQAVCEALFAQGLFSDQAERLFEGSYRGRWVQWTGTVTAATQAGRFDLDFNAEGMKVTVAVHRIKESFRERSCQALVLFPKDIRAPSAGDHIVFKARLDRVKTLFGKLYLTDGQLM